MRRYSFVFLLLFLVLSASGADVGRLFGPAFLSRSAGFVEERKVVRICAIRVEFISDEDPGTTGDGKFLKESGVECEFVVDPPPHDREYFKDHIKALANYYYHVSGGKLVIDTLSSEVFPLQDDGAYLLPHKMSYYHPFMEEDSVELRLVELFVDAVKLADEDVDYSMYDLVVVFHAGVGQDFNIVLDPTPYDIPSVYLGPANFMEVSTEAFPYAGGVPVNNNSVMINEGIILPETENHMLYPEGKDIFAGYENLCEYQIALNGTFALMFGFYLGLPALFNTETGETGIGKFGLMDQGSMNLNGLIPAFPSAWERIYMGWEEPVVAEDETLVHLKHVESNAGVSIWKIPINSREYFLVENRYSFIRPGVTLDSLLYRDYLNTGEWPSVFPYLKDSIGAVFSKRTGVLLSVPRYDVGLPGSGLLIWHIDEGVISANIASMGINNEIDRRGVDLEEADGAQDIGYSSGFIGQNINLGWYFDPWFAGNEGFFHLNPDYSVDSIRTIGFTPYTNPSTCSNDRSYTGIRIDSIGPAGEEMFFRIRFDRVGYRLGVGGRIAFDPLIFKLDNRALIAVFADSLYVFDIGGRLWGRADFKGLFDDGGVQIDFVTFVNGNIVVLASGGGGEYMLKYGVSPGGVEFVDRFTSVFSEVSSNFLCDGQNIVFAVGDTIFYWSSADGSVRGKYAGYNVIRLTGGRELPLYALCSDGSIIEIDRSRVIMDKAPGNLDGGVFHVSFLSGFINGNEFVDFGVVAGCNVYLVMDGETVHRKVVARELYEAGKDAILSDVDGDSQVEVIIASDKWLWVFNKELYVEDGFPVKLEGLLGGKLFMKGLLSVDITGDGINEILAEVEGAGVVAYERTGNRVGGFPMAIDRAEDYFPQVVNVEGKWFYVVVASDGESVRVVEIGDGSEDYDWVCYGANYLRSFCLPQRSQIVVAGGDGILDWEKVYCWPNPAKEGHTNIRFYVRDEECDVSVKIYDVAGNMVDELYMESPVLNDYNEILWDVSEVQSGVYFAVVKAVAGGREESGIVKILVGK